MNTQQVRDQIHQFFRWWVGELWGLVPDRFRSNGTARHKRLVLQAEDGTLALVQCRGDTRQELARLNLEPEALRESKQVLGLLGGALRDVADTLLRLPAGRVLRKTMVLPQAARENLRQVLAFEMDRQTPFRADQVYYDYRIAEGRATSGQLRVELAVVSRTFLDPLLDRLSQLGLRPTVVDVNHGDAQGAEVPCAPASINLLPPERRGQDDNKGVRLNLILGSVAALLLVVLLAIPLVQMQAAINVLETQVGVARKAANEVSVLREQLQGQLKETRFLVQKRKDSPRIIEALAELSLILPDGTSLNRFELNGTAIHIQGQSDRSSALIGLIEESDLFESVAFRSPVTQDPRTGRERFHISAEITSGASSS